jgi:hypothetical protein
MSLVSFAHAPRPEDITLPKYSRKMYDLYQDLDLDWYKETRNNTLSYIECIMIKYQYLAYMAWSDEVMTNFLSSDDSDIMILTIHYC